MSGVVPITGIGVAGTPAGGVVTVQGDPAGTPIPVTATVTGGTNFSTTELTSAARNADTNSADRSTTYARSVQMVVSVTALDPGGTISPTIQGKDSISGSYYNLNNVPVAIAAIGTYVYDMGPGTGVATGAVVSRAAGILPPTIRVHVASNGINVTYSVSFNFGV